MDPVDQTQQESRRRHPRYALQRSLQVVDTATQAPFGTLVNLSLQGFMLLGRQPFAMGETRALTLVLPEEIGGRRRLGVDVRCVWCQPAAYSQEYGAGFEIVRIAPDDQERLRQLCTA